jgi:molybdate transport system permease protein
MIEPLLLSLRLAAWTCVILLVIGAPLAWCLVRRRSAFSAVVETVLLMPLVLPPTVLGFYLLVLLGDGGLLSSTLGVRWAFTFEGILLGSVIFNLPFAMTAFSETFRAIPEDRWTPPERSAPHAFAWPARLCCPSPGRAFWPAPS